MINISTMELVPAEEKKTDERLVADTIQQPFDQKTHDLLLGSMDHVADEWIEQIKAVHNNLTQVEQLVLERTAKVKTDITQLYLLGNAVTSEARRGVTLNQKLVAELEKLAELKP